MSDQLRIGLIGVGRHGRRYAKHLTQGDVKRARLSALWRRDSTLGREDEKTFGARFVPRLSDLLHAEDIDALICVVPAGSHLEIGLQVAQAQKPMLLEKPMARTVAEAEQLLKAFEKAQQPLTIAQTLRFDPLTTALKARCQEDRSLGALRGFGFEQRLEQRGLRWEDVPEDSGGGVIIQTGIHTIDALRFVTGGSVHTRNAAVGRVHYQHNEDLALLHLALQTEHGELLGDVRVSKIGESRHMRFSLFFDQGGLEADYIERKLYETRGRERTVTEIPEAWTLLGVTQGFVDHVQGRGPNPVPPQDALESLRVVEQAYALQ